MLAWPRCNQKAARAVERHTSSPTSPTSGCLQGTDSDGTHHKLKERYLSFTLFKGYSRGTRRYLRPDFTNEPRPFDAQQRRQSEKVRLLIDATQLMHRQQHAATQEQTRVGTHRRTALPAPRAPAGRRDGTDAHLFDESPSRMSGSALYAAYGGACTQQRLGPDGEPSSDRSAVMPLRVPRVGRDARAGRVRQSREMGRVIPGVQRKSVPRLRT